MSLLLDPLLWTCIVTGAIAIWLRLGFVPHLLATLTILLWAAWSAKDGARPDGATSLALWTLSTAAVLMGVEAVRPHRVDHRARIEGRVLRSFTSGTGLGARGVRAVLRPTAATLRGLSWLLARGARGAARTAAKLHEAAQDSRRMEPIERVDVDGTLYAIIVRAAYREPGVSFVTPPESQFQVGVLTHPMGRVIKAHVHRTRPQQVTGTPEVLLVREGKVRTDFYKPDGTYVTSKTLAAGDTLLLVDGGHGFEVLEPCVMIEVKQGPYRGVAEDKRLLDDKP